MIPDAKGEDGGTIKCRRCRNRGFIKMGRWVQKFKSCSIHLISLADFEATFLAGSSTTYLYGQGYCHRPKGRGGGAMAFCHSDGLCQHYKWGQRTNATQERGHQHNGERGREICVKHLTQHNIAYNENSLEHAAHYHASVSALQLSKRPFLRNQYQSGGHLSPLCTVDC